MEEKAYNKTLCACFIAYVVQAIVNSFASLLFLTFHNSYGIPMSQITLLITFNFGVQLTVDLASVPVVNRLGYRRAMLLAHACAGAGLLMITVLPELLPSAFAGLLVSVALYAVGGGLIEVLVSPIVEACPTKNKEMAMSLLHSFYCWGQMAVVLVSTIVFRLIGIENWKIMACVWALVPFLNLLLFIKAPIAPLVAEGEREMTPRELFKNKLFWVFVVMMLCAGAGEQAVSQWASAFAEAALHVDKTVGDLAGPMLYAAMMGISRTLYGKYGEGIDLDRFMMGSGVLCVAAYLCISLSPSAAVSLAGYALCGFSVGIIWPGTFSKATESIKRGGTAMFAFLALAGDVGCSVGPTLVGFVSGALGDDLKRGILAGIVFPLVLLASLRLCGRLGAKSEKVN